MKRLSKAIIFESDTLGQDLARRSIRGGLTTLGSQGVELALSLLSTVVLARLLTPDDYGLLGMVAVIVGFVQMFKDAGLSLATIQRDHITHEQISTLFWLNIAISTVLGLCILASAPLVSRLYGRPELTAVTAAMSLAFIVSGLLIQHQALLRRCMWFGALAGITIVSQIVALGTMIALAYLGWRYWALVGGALVRASATTLLTFYFCPWVPGRMKRRTGVRAMLKFGGHLTGFNFVNYFSRNADNILIGRYLGAGPLGLYAKAYQLFMMPITQVRQPMSLVAMPVLSSLRDQPARYRRYYNRMFDILVSLTIPITLYCILEGEFLIRLVLGPKWLGAAPVFRILAVAGFMQAILGMGGLVMLSLGYSARVLTWGVVNACISVASFVIGLPFGINGVATCYAVANGIILFPTLFVCYHKSPITVGLIMKTLATPLLTSVAALAAVLFLRHASPGESTASHLLQLGVYCGIVLVASCARPEFKETLGLLLQDVKLRPANGLSANVK